VGKWGSGEVGKWGSGVWLWGAWLLALPLKGRAVDDAENESL
jgi:hypothetical protein